MSNSRNAVPDYDPRHFPEKFKGKWSLVSLEEGTCCYRAAKYFSTHAFETPPVLITEPTFYDGRNRAEKEPHSILLLPCVHEICGEVYTSKNWELLDSLIFHIPNPPLYLARAKKLPNHQRQVCASIRRLRTLLDEPNTLWGGEFLDVDTTQQAAKMVAVDRRCGFCITNHDGLMKYDLDVVQELKRMMMGWYPFTAKSNGSATWEK